MRPLVVSALAAASLAALATPAAARSTRTVVYSDLDLSNAAGRTMLRQRVTNAVDQVCGPVEVRNVHSGTEVAACRTDTWAAVQPQLDAALGASVELVADARITIPAKRGAR